MREDLREHIDNPDYFDQNTDSYHIVQAIKLLSGNPLAWFACYEIAVDRLLVKFAKPHKETTMLLAEKGMLDFKVLYEMFNRWDATFFPEGKVKSDVCARAVLRAIGTKMPRKAVFGWDLRPLPDGWQQPNRSSLLVLAQMVGTYLQTEEKLDKDKDFRV